MLEISGLKSNIGELKQSNEEVVKEKNSAKFQLDYTQHELKEEQQTIKDLLTEINNINSQISDMEINSKEVSLAKDVQLRELQASIDAQKVTISSQDRRIKDKDKRL